MKRHSISELERLTGYDRRTLSKRLEGQEAVKKGRSLTYTLRQVLEAFDKHSKRNSEILNLEQERALLARTQREKLERENALELSHLLRADRVLALWSTFIVQARQKVLNFEISDEQKQELIEEFREIKLGEYK